MSPSYAKSNYLGGETRNRFHKKTPIQPNPNPNRNPGIDTYPELLGCSLCIDSFWSLSGVLEFGGVGVAAAA